MNAEITTHPWAPRKIVGEILEKIKTAAANGELLILLIHGKAGYGKTYLGRALGVRLGSPDGNEPGSADTESGGPLLWSGLLDVFDTETNSNQGLEQRLIQAYDPFEDKFSAYNKERGLYDLHFKTGILGPGVEKQRRAIEKAFAEGLENVCKDGYPVAALDTTERLESASDPVQRELNLEKDTASVIGWLLFQLCELPKGAILLFGRQRPDSYFQEALEKALPDIRAGGKRAVRYEVIEVGGLQGEDLEAYFSHRLRTYPELKKILTSELKGNLHRYTEGNPLLLDIALLLLHEDPHPARLIALFEQTQQLNNPAEEVQDRLLQDLLGLYHDLSANPERKLLLDYLAVARNGLFPELLSGIALQDSERLKSELDKIESLPFVKVRLVYVGATGERQRQPRKTYFLHDELYRSYDRRIESADWIARTSERIAGWYDEQILMAQQEQASLKESYQGAFIADMLVESLLYRLRANLQAGYEWFLTEEDKAIRTNLSVGLDMRLRDGMAQYANQATEENQEPGLTLTSMFDRQNPALNPLFMSQYQIDMAMLWIKRTSARGDQREAVRIGKALAEQVKSEYLKYPQELAPAYTEFCLWFGQALMYLGETQESKVIYRTGLHTLEVETFALTDIIKSRLDREPSGFKKWRICMVAGRLWNNLGYLDWMNIGQFRQAMVYFQHAKSWYLEGNRVRMSSLDEEIANSNDNLGRVNGLLGYYAKARDLTRRSFKERKELGLRYRAALSATSLAIVLASEGQHALAEKFASDGLLEFENAEADRGTGLGLLTHAMILRNQAEEWRENEVQFADARRWLDNAEIELRRAEKIFTPMAITESIRQVQLYNELGCVYRTCFLLMKSQPDTNPRYLEQILKQGAAALNHAADLAEKYQFPVERIDSLQDLAVLYFRARNLGDAEKSLQKIDSFFADKPEYRIQEGIGLVQLKAEDCIDPYYKVLGQVELLRGGIEYERGLREAKEHDSQAMTPGEAGIQRTVQHYLFAIEYFRRYSGEAYSMQRAFGRMYSRLEHCSPELVDSLATTFIPALKEQYRLSPETVRGFLEDIFGRTYSA